MPRSDTRGRSGQRSFEDRFFLSSASAEMPSSRITDHQGAGKPFCLSPHTSPLTPYGSSVAHRTELFVIDQLFYRRVLTADRALAVSGDWESTRLNSSH